MRMTPEGIGYSPSDLIEFLESPFASWMSRQHLEDPSAAEPDPDDPLMAMLARRGQEHEDRFLGRLREQGLDTVDVPRETAEHITREAITAGRQVIYQPLLHAGPFRGYADFLRLGADGTYSIWDTKLSRKPKPYFLIQLCSYADMLEAMTGVRPFTIGVVLGNGEEHKFRTSDFFQYYCRIRDAFLGLMAEFPGNGPPTPVSTANQGRWQGAADGWLKERDHLSQVANISRSQIDKLNKAGVNTMSELAAALPSRITGMGEDVLRHLHRQAFLQVTSLGQLRPSYEMLDTPEHRSLGLGRLPQPSPNDVYFDMEGFPAAEDWLEYLFGAVHVDGSEVQFVDWWAHNERQERQAFEQFVDWIYDRWKRDPTMHVYHYAAYETSALKRLMGKYGSREDQVDDLLRAGVFIDLYSIARHSILVGEPAYSLKNLEHLYTDRRSGDVKDAGTSVAVYDAWSGSGESDRWHESPLLKSIRDYNESDCRSTWQLAEWLRARKREVPGTPAASQMGAEELEEVAINPDRAARQELATRILQSLPDTPPVDEALAQRCRNLEMLAYLLEFHRRADKPMWWSVFERQGMSTDDLWHDMDCLASIRRAGAFTKQARSRIYTYTFDPDQDTKLHEGSDISFAPDLGVTASIYSFDPDGCVSIKISEQKLKGAGLSDLPEVTSIIPYEFVSAAEIEKSIERTARRAFDSGEVPQALADFLAQAKPRLVRDGPLQGDGEDHVTAATRIALNLNHSCLCIQGPPGTGKTHTAGAVIGALLKAGKSVGIASNGHKAILNLMKAVCKTAPGTYRGTKVGGDKDEPVLQEYPEISWVAGGATAEGSYQGQMVGGTAWFFSRAGMADQLDYLFVDEAGQVSVANLVGMAPSAKNLILLGDQMQLGQPIQGTHPGKSGQSVLEYYLGDHATIPPERGLFLDQTWRLHPSICQFISEAVYEGRLRPKARTANRLVRVRPGARYICHDSGIVFVPVEHSGNTQCSDEEVDVIAAIVAELSGRERTDEHGVTCAPIVPSKDILVVAPYNMQVRRLKARLPAGCRVGSVDKFQGQESAIVIISMCASPGESGGRGLRFVLDKHRLNVAISRAESLAIVVGDPRLAYSPCSSIDDMRCLNLASWIQNVGASPPVGVTQRAAVG